MGQTIYYTNDPKIVEYVFKEFVFFIKEINKAYLLYRVKSSYINVFLTSIYTKIWRETYKFMVFSMEFKAINKHALIVLAIVWSTFLIFDKLKNGKRA